MVNILKTETDRRAAARGPRQPGLGTWSLIIGHWSFRAERGGFTLLELVMSLALGSVVFGAALAGIVALQKSYASTEQYATDLADQTRLLDYLAMDLRRASGANVTTDADGNTTGINLWLPDYYDFSSGSPAPFAPSIYLNPEPCVAFYGSRVKLPTVTYTLTKPAGSRTGPVFRQELRGDGGIVSAANVADRVVRLQVNFDDANGADSTFATAVEARLSATFQPIFQTPAVPDPSSPAIPVLTLHGMAFLRNNDARLH